MEHRGTTLTVDVIRLMRRMSDKLQDEYNDNRRRLHGRTAHISRIRSSVVLARCCRRSSIDQFGLRVGLSFAETPISRMQFEQSG